jgi:hypothetical protein
MLQQQTQSTSLEWMLYWRELPLGRVTNISVDWPWGYGRFEAGEWPADLRTSIEFWSRCFYDELSDQELEDFPGIDEEFTENWSLVDAQGMITNLTTAPWINFDDCSIDMRSRWY